MTQASQYHKSVSQQHRDDDLAARCEASMREYVAGRFKVIDWDDNFPAVELPVPVKSRPAPRKRKPVRAPVPDDLLTKGEAASRLRCSVKTLDAHVTAGAIRYVEIGRGMNQGAENRAHRHANLGSRRADPRSDHGQWRTRDPRRWHLGPRPGPEPALRAH